MQATPAFYGRIDVLVNNGDSLALGPAEEVTMTELRQHMEVVFFGAAEVTKAVVPLMCGLGSGTIVQRLDAAGRGGPGAAFLAAQLATGHG